MKIVQDLAFCKPNYVGTTTGWQVTGHRVSFDPDLYTGITQILFNATGYYSGAATSLTVRLVNDDTDVVITTLPAFTGIRSQKISADIKASLTSAIHLRVEANTGNGGPSDRGQVFTPSITIFQDTTGASRKTAAIIPLILPTSTNYDYYTDAWYCNRFKPPIKSFDGTVEVRVIYLMKGFVSGSAFAKIRGVTVETDVTGSEFELDSGEALTYCVTGPLTFDDLIYKVQVKASGGGGYMEIYGAWLQISTTGFTKCASIVCSFGPQLVVAALWYVGYGAMRQFYIDDITGPDGIDWELDDQVNVTLIQTKTFYWRIFDETTGKAIIESVNQIKKSGTGPIFNAIIPTLPDGVDLLYQQTKGSGSNYQGPTILFATLYENDLSGASLPADQTQPSGYHSFMAQFLKNLMAGLIPLKTPDGVNKLW